MFYYKLQLMCKYIFFLQISIKQKGLYDQIMFSYKLLKGVIAYH